MIEESSEKSALVPRLRFPEFREAEEWKQKTLADVCLRITNGKANAEDHEDGGIYPLYDRSEVVKQSSEFVFDDEAIIIPGEGMRFQPKYYKGKFNLHQRAYALMQHQEKARFVYYSMDRFKDTLAKNAVKSTVLSLRLPIIERFGLAVPTKAEQQKIADCLSSLDELITAEAQKLDALKTHKKGMMQQLFPREGETVPRLRFPEFREARGWEETQLIQALKFQPGFPFLSKGFNSEAVGLRLIRNRDLRSDEKPVHFSGPYNDDFVVDNDDILVGMDGDFTPCVWKKGKALLNQRVGRVLPKKGSVQRFLFYYLSVHLKAIEDATARTTVKHLSHSDVEKIFEPLPKMPEQEKIADCLSSLDDLITAQSQKIDALKAHKKGLMQQLFPVLEEVPA